jgi:hypothetical protein
LGGQALSGTFRKKKASKIIFQIYHFFFKYEKIFPDIQKNFPDVWYFSRKLKTFSGNNLNSSFHKCPLGKKCNLNDIFTQEKGTLLPGKGHLAKLGWPGSPWPPRFLRPWRPGRKYLELTSQFYITQSESSNCLQLWHLWFVIHVCAQCT